MTAERCANSSTAVNRRSPRYSIAARGRTCGRGLSMSMRYSLNFVWPTVFNRPFTR
jgi:hypothetical protein